VFRDALVIFNGYIIEHADSGYTPFRVDVTDLAVIGGDNVLTLRVDASLGEGWFYEGAGIYRHVWLVKTAPVHVPQWGVVVRAAVDGTLSIDTDLINESDARAEFSLQHTVLDGQRQAGAGPRAGPRPFAGLGAAVAGPDRATTHPRPVVAGEPASLHPGHRDQGRRRGGRSVHDAVRRARRRVSIPTRASSSTTSP
jgi:hypothetical protein